MSKAWRVFIGRSHRPTGILDWVPFTNVRATCQEEAIDQALLLQGELEDGWAAISAYAVAEVAVGREFKLAPVRSPAYRRVEE